MPDGHALRSRVRAYLHLDLLLQLLHGFLLGRAESGQTLLSVPWNETQAERCENCDSSQRQALLWTQVFIPGSFPRCILSGFLLFLPLLLNAGLLLLPLHEQLLHPGLPLSFQEPFSLLQGNKVTLKTDVNVKIKRYSV